MRIVKRKEKISEPREIAKTIFAVVNLLPPGLKLPDDFKVYESLCKEDPEGRIAAFDKAFTEEWFDELDKKSGLGRDLVDMQYEIQFHGTYEYYRLRGLKICLEGLPTDFVEYVNLPETHLEWLYESFAHNNLSLHHRNRVAPRNIDAHPEAPDKERFRDATHEACLRYYQAHSWYERLYCLAQYLQSDFENTEWFTRLDPAARVFRINNIAVIDGRIGIEPDEFTDAFLGVGIERIKLCKNCGRVFWAKRDDMKGCSTSCAKILRTRKWREKTTKEQRTKYKINRIQKDEKKGGK
jgi:hypothetical protein